MYYNPKTNDVIAIDDYDIELAKKSNTESDVYRHDDEMISNGYIPIIPPKVRGKLGCWTWSMSKFNNEKNNIVITGKKDKYQVKKRTFVDKESIELINEKYFYRTTTESNSRSIIDFSTNEGTNTLSAVMGKSGIFNNPKNMEMIKYLLSLSPFKNGIILDFFAGSGTTGQAALELNKEDGGNRKFILCTNNENNICEDVTYERIKRVINGYAEVEGISANLKYFKTDFISKDADDVTEELLSHIKEMVELENGITLDNKKHLIVLSDEEADRLEKDWDNYDEVKGIYVSRNVLFTTSQNALFSNVEIHVIPNYYFEYELKEVGESW